MGQPQTSLPLPEVKSFTPSQYNPLPSSTLPIVAGARAVQVGTANFVDAQSAEKLVAALKGKLQEAGVAKLADLVGTVRRGG